MLEEGETQPPKNKTVIQPALLNNRGVKDLPVNSDDPGKIFWTGRFK
ncbi:MAG: hypothetical protein ABII90_00305 [Bacteroidota bacterium]